MKTYYVAFQYNENGVSGFGSIAIENVNFNPFTINGMRKLGQLTNQLLSGNSPFQFNIDIIILNVIPLEDE